MINVSTEELQGILATIENALAMHDQWRDRLQRTLICKLPPEPVWLAEDAHQHCQFGNWFYGPGNAHLRKLETFKHVERLHREMHDLARDLGTRLRAHAMISTGDYDPFIEKLSEFRAELTLVLRKVEDTLNNIDALTGAFRSGLLLPDLRKVQEAQRTVGEPYSLLLVRFDLDDVNRLHSHDKGDAILRAGVSAIRDNLDSRDRVYRYTGAAFVICLPGRSREAAQALQPTLVRQMAETLMRVVGEIDATLPVHYGIVAIEPDAYLEQLISQAAMATYTIQM